MVPPTHQPARRSLGHVRLRIHERLEARRSEIEDTILTRAFAVSRPTGRESADYVRGLRAAVAAAVDYGLAAIAGGAERPDPPPSAVLAQARNAARNRIGIDVVLRRYAAGYSALGDFLMQQAGLDATVTATDLYRFQRELTALFDRLVEAVSVEYEREAQGASPVRRRLAERVRRLLAGEFVDLGEIAYDFDAHHLGLIATGPEAEQALGEMARTLDRRLLRVQAEDGVHWAWLGGERALRRDRIDEALAAFRAPDGVLLAFGEPGRGLGGWRLSHRQAITALSVASRTSQLLTRYADVALVAALLRDEDLVRFLADAYLVPLRTERDGGTVLRRTLSAYFTADRNASSAAAALGVSRQTVKARLRAFEERLGRTLDACGLELEAALRLADLAPNAGAALAKTVPPARVPR